MAQFNINWYNTAVIVNPNVTGQRVSYRQKSVGGAYSTGGFTPANNLPKTASSSLSPDLQSNRIWEFRVEAICEEGGPTLNDNGNQEAIHFACLVPTLSSTSTTSTITLNVANLDIHQATFILHKLDDDSVVAGPTTVAKTGTAITYTATGLEENTEYYWEFITYAIVNGLEIQSSSQIGDACYSEDVITDAVTCDPLTNIDVHVEEWTPGE